MFGLFNLRYVSLINLKSRALLEYCFFSLQYLVVILQTGLEKSVFGSHPVSMTAPDRGPPPAFSSDPLKRVSGAGGIEGMKNEATVGVGTGSSRATTQDIVEIEGSPASSNHEPNFVKAGSPATVRLLFKSAFEVCCQCLESAFKNSCSFCCSIVSRNFLLVRQC